MPRQEGTTPNLLSRLRGDEGTVTSSLIILPMVLVAIFLAIHFGLVLHGRNVAAAAAQDGLQAAQLDGATAHNGRAAAKSTLAKFASIDANVNITRDRNHVTVTITGTTHTFFDGLFNSFDISLSGPVERFYAESERE